MNNCTPRCMATKVLILGIIILLVRQYTSWDIWLVIGTLMIIKAIIMIIMPVCKCQTAVVKSARKR